MNDTYRLSHWIKTHGDLALDLVRIYLGIGLMIKAVYFVHHTEYLSQIMDNGGRLWFAPGLMIHYIVLTHFCGGACLALGMFTRTAALIQLPILFCAVFYVHLPQMGDSVEARQSLEFAALMLFLLVLIFIYGAGRLSVDYLWSRKEHCDLFVTGPSADKPV